MKDKNIEMTDLNKWTLKIIDINTDNKLHNHKLMLRQLPLMMNIEEHLNHSKMMD
tara:strand:+ start:206 stop:370 length:165 start_codon:yes stop_codon:yes gene_type:complete